MEMKGLYINGCQLSGETLSSNPLLMLDMAHTWGKTPVISFKVLVLVHALLLSESSVISKISNISVTRKKNEITKDVLSD